MSRVKRMIFMRIRTIRTTELFLFFGVQSEPVSQSTKLVHFESNVDVESQIYFESQFFLSPKFFWVPNFIESNFLYFVHDSIFFSRLSTALLVHTTCTYYHYTLQPQRTALPLRLRLPTTTTTTHYDYHYPLQVPLPLRTITTERITTAPHLAPKLTRI